MDLEQALGRLGKYGKWQIIFYLVLSISTTFPASWHMLAIVFLAVIPEHRCKLPDGQTVNDSIPLETNPEGEVEFSKCLMYTNSSVDNSTEKCPNGWEYTGDMGPTIVSEWDLVCDDDYLKEMTQTIMVIGVMIGALICSAISDTCGRKPVFLVSQWGMVVIGVVSVFATNWYFFVVLRFLAGVLQQGIIIIGFVMACELFPAKYRTFAGTAIEIFWGVAMCLFALFAYAIRHWRYLQLTITLPGLLTLSFLWILPESIPWLCANGRHAEAEKILQDAAKMNGVPMPNPILATMEGQQMLEGDQSTANGKKSGGLLSRLGLKRTKQAPRGPRAAKYTFVDVFRHRRLCLYAIIMCLLWLVNSLVYYGLSLSTEALAGDRYFNYFLSGLVEIPAYASTIFVLQKFGRRWPLAIYHIVAGIALVVTMFIPKETESGVNLLPLRMFFNMVGKFGITGSFAIVFLYAPEIFPTTLRSQAMGIASVGGRLGNMLAPFSSLIARILPMLPGILFGSLSIGVGLLAFLLPETLNRPLPQTIEDINSWSRTVPKQPKKNNDQKHEMGLVSDGAPS